jgi:thiamine-monophosphate kinase
MSISEFDLIQHFFNQAKHNRSDVLQGIGDDGAVLQVPSDQQLVVTTDTLVMGRHFPENTSPADMAYKALAVNLSDLAAMGATPTWILLALTLPTADEAWLAEFSQGFFSLLDQFNLQLIGGDVTQGPLTITAQAMGFVPPGKALLRSGAKPGDRIYVTGTLGDAGLALRYLQKKISLDLNEQQKRCLLQRLNRPTPRIEWGLVLRGMASSAIDISDGLAADLGHILAASQVGASVAVDKLPLSETLQALPLEQAWQLALSAGDDYELCFTVPPTCEAQLQHSLKSRACPFACIGVIQKGPGLFLYDATGSPFVLQQSGFQHFIETSYEKNADI